MAASASEINSLEEISYKSRIKFFLLAILCFFLFVTAFLNFYPIGDKIKTQLKNNLQGSACNPDYSELHFEWILPKIVISDLVLPATCFGRAGEPVKFSHLTLNFQVINFSPLGLPFKLETEVSGQPLTIYYVLGFGQQLIRMKDQAINLSRLEAFMGEFKIAGNITADVNLLMSNNAIKNLNIRAASKNLQLPPQSLQGFNLPNLKFNEFYLEAKTSVPPRLVVERMVLGNTESPIRANFKGRIDLQDGAIAFSPMDLVGEVAFSPELKETIPLIDMMFQTFAQKMASIK